MNINKKEQWYKQVKAINGEGTRHLVMYNDTTVKDVKDMAEKKCSSQMICQKKKKNLSRYSTYIESSQAHVETSKTLE